MRVLSILMLVFVFAACGNTDEVGDSSNSNSTPSEDSRDRTLDGPDDGVDTAPASIADGVVVDQTSEEGCGFMIKVMMGNIEKVLDPGSLSDEFKKDGLEVTVTFSFSRMQSTCPGTQPIILDEIKLK